MRVTVMSALLLLCVACGDDHPRGTVDESASMGLRAGTWRAEVTLPGGVLPFQLEVLPAPQGGVYAYVINGQERVPVTEPLHGPAGVQLEFPAFNNRIYGSADDDEFYGELEIIKRHGKIQRMPVRMRRGPDYRFFGQRQNVNADFSGRWEVEFIDDDGVSSPAVAEFVQKNGVVTGTFRTPTGDYRFLAGEVSDRTLHLSTFDGAHAFLFSATMDGAGHLAGDFWSGTQWHEAWTAMKNANAVLPDADQLTKITDTEQPFVVAFPDVDGRIVRSDEARFQDKVLLIALAGSWCPNCHDEAAFLAPFYKQYKESGLEIIGLMYEHLDDFDEAARQVRRFRDKFDIEYPLLVAGSSDKGKASETLPLLTEVIAYPTIIVIDRNAVVRRIHTGFNGPGTGAVYEEFRKEFTRFIENILEEEAG
ncbi:MAG: redoxin family protein [Gammaproteobacteria bacterium]|nr:redoxin family protein [Gammaproteobacteria bacterium]